MNYNYRLLHKSDGTYVLQVEIGYVDENEKGYKRYKTYWQTLDTIEELDDKGN